MSCFILHSHNHRSTIDERCMRGNVPLDPKRYRAPCIRACNASSRAYVWSASLAGLGRVLQLGVAKRPSLPSRGDNGHKALRPLSS